jgi:hypothetical protein
MVKQMISMRRKFPNYKSFSAADISVVLDKEAQNKALVLRATTFESCYVQNNGNGAFEMKQLPPQAQWSPINGMIADDVDGDGFLDLLAVGNDYGNEVVNGRYDALNGLVLLGDGSGNFRALPLPQAGFLVPGDAKGLVKLLAGNRLSVAATQNRGKLQLFSLRSELPVIRFKPDDDYAILSLANGKQRKVEACYGTSFLSQSSRFFVVDSNVRSIEIVNRKREKRRVNRDDR